MLAEGRALVANGGFEALRVAALAARAEIAAGTVYRYFDNRAALAVEVFSLVSSRELEMLSTALQAEGIAVGVRRWIERAQAAPVLARALLYEPVCPEVEAARLAFRARYVDVLALSIEGDVAAGRLPPQHAATSARCVIGAMAESVLGPRGPASADEVVLFCIHALRRERLEPS